VPPRGGHKILLNGFGLTLGEDSLHHICLCILAEAWLKGGHPIKPVTYGCARQIKNGLGLRHSEWSSRSARRLSYVG
jgi:hypothetical protein